ncbi:hypothetical protein C7G41_26930 [Bradyrhizobium sp. MOS002]|jgi:hypothetical protein|nr:hypothetical protein C7G41_26930 [Bradyrhizobium sp. MOS002]
MRLYGFRDGDNGGAMMNWARCSRQKLGVIARLDRAIQYAAAFPHALLFLEYWIPRLRGE